MHNKSRKLAYLLRHDKEYDFDGRGWRTVADLVENHGFTFAELHHIVTSNNKQRFEFSDKMSMIRARQGHSVDVDAELEEKVPPAILYHGTAKKNIESILNNGISPGKRLHVHLSAEKETAIKVGKRHGEPAVLAIDTKRMCEKGIKFYLSRNGVWLTEYVATEFINL
jgi:putative RNA 2'-phosphotransferase